MWPLSVVGLLLLATVGLLNSAPNAGRRARAVVWRAFLLGTAVSLAANVAAAPAPAWRPMSVAGRPPVALLLSMELLVHRSVGRERGERRVEAAESRWAVTRRDTQRLGRRAIGLGLPERRPRT